MLFQGFLLHMLNFLKIFLCVLFFLILLWSHSITSTTSRTNSTNYSPIPQQSKHSIFNLIFRYLFFANLFFCHVVFSVLIHFRVYIFLWPAWRAICRFHFRSKQFIIMLSLAHSITTLKLLGHFSFFADSLTFRVDGVCNYTA